jgi:hypothetical protein
VPRYRSSCCRSAGLVWVVFALFGGGADGGGVMWPRSWLRCLHPLSDHPIARIISGVVLRTVPPDVAELHEPLARSIHVATGAADRLAQFASADAAGTLAHQRVDFYVPSRAWEPRAICVGAG